MQFFNTIGNRNNNFCTSYEHGLLYSVKLKHRKRSQKARNELSIGGKSFGTKTGGDGEMIRSLNSVNRSMNVLQKRQENTGANISNTTTPGYKFQDIVQSTLKSNTIINNTGEMNSKRELGNWTFGMELSEMVQNFEQGSLNETEDPLDFAISGRGFFTIALNDGGLAYTRNGNFLLDEQNKLVTMERNDVLGIGTNGNQSPVYLDPDGKIRDGVELLVTDFEDYQQLERIGETMFTAPTGGSRLQNAEMQGFLEMSNVIIADEMVKLIEIAREFEANQKLLHTSDETLSKAVNEVGRV